VKVAHFVFMSLVVYRWKVCVSVLSVLFVVISHFFSMFLILFLIIGPHFASKYVYVH
jgi:hypothetical protein